MINDNRSGHSTGSLANDAKTPASADAVTTCDAASTALIRQTIQRCREAVAARLPGVQAEEALDALLADCGGVATIADRDQCEMCGVESGDESSVNADDGILICAQCDAARDSICPVSPVYLICDRYEAGFGRGMKHGELDYNRPAHDLPEHAEAYQLGFLRGRRAGTKRNAADPELMEALKATAAVAYQVAVLFRAPQRFQDAFSDAAGGMIAGNPFDLLPVTEDEVPPRAPVTLMTGTHCCVSCRRQSLFHMEEGASVCVYCDIEEVGRLTADVVTVVNSLRMLAEDRMQGKLDDAAFWDEASALLTPAGAAAPTANADREQAA